MGNIEDIGLESGSQTCSIRRNNLDNNILNHSLWLPVKREVEIDVVLAQEHSYKSL